MVVGIGVDIIEIERVKNAVKRPGFLTKYFSAGEREFLLGKKNYARSAAMNFAAKEAFAKAMGTGVRGFSLCEVEILRDDAGKPYINLYGQAKQIADSIGAERLSVSLSDAKEMAIAFVIAEG